MERIKKTGGKSIVISAAVWAVTYFTCLLIVKELSPSTLVGVILSFLPTITFAIFLYHFIKGVSSMDEVERRIQLEATVFAFALALLMIMTLGLLDLVVVLNKEDWGYRHLIPFFVAFYFFGLFVSRKKYM